METDADVRGADLLLSALPRTAQVLDVTAHCRLHQFYGSRQGAVEKLGLLAPDELQSLARPHPVTASPTGVSLDDIDRKILRELAIDGRLSTDQISRAANSPVAMVRRRIDSLVDREVLYFDVELDNRLLNNGVEAVLWLKVEPSSLHEAGITLGSHREVAFAAACTGPAALLAYVSVSDPTTLYTYLTSSIATLPGVREVESAPVIRVLKGPGTLLPP